MSDDEKKVEKHCECECCKKIAKFFYLAGAVFLGTLLAILVSYALLAPKNPPCPCAMRGHHAGIEHQMPPMMGQNGFAGPQKMHKGCPLMQKKLEAKKHFEGQKGERPNFNPQQRPEK